MAATRTSDLSSGGPPANHAASHASGGTDPVTLAQSQVTNLVADLAGKAATAHASTHKGGGSDAIDVATTSVAGLMSATDKTKLDGIGAASTGLVILGPKTALTPEGGYAIKMTNRIGIASVKGTVVRASSSYDSAVSAVAVGSVDPIGVMYETGVADGAETWIVTSGIAEVYYAGSTAPGQFARVTVDGDTGASAGVAIAEAAPSPPLATDKHFQEIGHVIQGRVGAGLALTVLHFN